jgi:hypothetical protein
VTLLGYEYQCRALSERWNLRGVDSEDRPQHCEVQQERPELR